MQHTVLLFLIQDDQILLARKKRGHGQGKMNGVGGKIEADETPVEAVIRECQEEIGVTPIAPEKVAHLIFHEQAPGDAKTSIACHVYIATDWEGEPIETQEMNPEWFFIDMIPYDKMWQDDAYWLPHVLAGQCVAGDFHFDADGELTDHEIAVVEPKDLP